MRLALSLVGAVCAAFAVSGEAYAGPATDAFSHCLVQASSGRDRAAFMKWLFSAMAAHPDVQGMSTITEEQRKTMTADAAVVFNRLVLKDCRAEAVSAVRQDGDGALSSAFEVFGRIAMTDLMSDKQVSRAVTSLGAYADEKSLAELLAEAKKN